MVTQFFKNIQFTMKLNSSEIDVSREDQGKINTFSRLNMQFHDKNRQIQNKQEQKLAYEEAVDELELMDDDEKIQYKFGDCFFLVSVVEAKDLIGRQIEQLKKQSTELQVQIDDHKKQMNSLKAKLYAKFGNQINLDED